MAVTAIGIDKPVLREETVAAARRIGRGDVDQCETGCRTPDAEGDTRKAFARNRPAKKAARSQR